MDWVKIECAELSFQNECSRVSRVEKGVKVFRACILFHNFSACRERKLIWEQSMRKPSLMQYVESVPSDGIRRLPRATRAPSRAWRPAESSSICINEKSRVAFVASSCGFQRVRFTLVCPCSEEETESGGERRTNRFPESCFQLYKATFLQDPKNNFQPLIVLASLLASTPANISWKATLNANRDLSEDVCHKNTSFEIDSRTIPKNSQRPNSRTTLREPAISPSN